MKYQASQLSNYRSLNFQDYSNYRSLNYSRRILWLHSTTIIALLYCIIEFSRFFRCLLKSGGTGFRWVFFLYWLWVSFFLGASEKANHYISLKPWREKGGRLFLAFFVRNRVGWNVSFGESFVFLLKEVVYILASKFESCFTQTITFQ